MIGKLLDIPVIICLALVLVFLVVQFILTRGKRL